MTNHCDGAKVEPEIDWRNTDESNSDWVIVRSNDRERGITKFARWPEAA
jgi:hypothetical protein